jgi:ABC-2 type transport system permease protein
VHAVRNYRALIGLSVFQMTCLLIFAYLWKVAAARQGALNLSADDLLWYIAFNECVLIALPDLPDTIEQDLRSGRLAYLLPRPISYLGATFAEGLGTLTVNLMVLGIVGVLFTWARIGSFPFHPLCLIPMAALSLLAGAVAMVFQMIVGLSAFWIKEVSPFNWIWERLLFVFGGLILPLSVYPEALQNIAKLTPFEPILGGRSGLVFNFDLAPFLAVVGTLVCWGLLGGAGLYWIYRRGLRIVNIEGG